MVALLELRVREAEEHLAELALGEVVGQVAHGVRSESRDILVLYNKRTQQNGQNTRRID